MANGKNKILFIVEAMGGGVFTYIVSLANELVKDYNVYVAYAIRKQTPPNYRDYFDKHVQLIEVKNFCREISPIRDIKAILEIKSIEKKIDPDIIHLHSSKAGALGRFAFNGKNASLFYTPHGYSFLMQNDNVIKRTLYWFIEVICSKRNCTTISCSKGEHQETLKITKNAIYVNNGINIKELQTLMDQVGPIEKHPFTVFTIGRICYQKNPILFNQIAEMLPDIHFLWIGDGELKKELTASNIEITGWIERRDVIKCALHSDIFILTSLWEGLPISLLEAMYMKKLCIVSDVIGNRDVICNGENGFICTTAEDYSERIKKTMKKSPQKLIQNAYKSIIETYNTEHMKKRYAEIYNKCNKSN